MKSTCPSIISALALALGLTLLPAAAGTERAGEEPAPQAAHRPSAEAMIVDGLIYRPLYLAGTVIGAGIFIVTLPFSLPGGNAAEAGERLVLEPARDLFGRCLGCLVQDEHW